MSRKGWKGESVRHSNARRLGRAGPMYKKTKKKNRYILYEYGKKIKLRTLNKLIAEEKEGAHTYHKLGFHAMAGDEERHARTLSAMRHSKGNPKSKPIIVMRSRRQEESTVPLWFASRNWKILVSVVGGPGDTRMRISTPKGRQEFGYPFACGGKTTPREYWVKCIRNNERKFRKSAARYLKGIGYNVKI